MRPRILPGYTSRPSPNQSDRNGCEPTLLVIHYTASMSDDGDLRWLRSDQSNVSAHFVIARDGRVTQLVPLDRAAWHAGISKWVYQGEQRRDVNDFSVGVELCNAGPVFRSGSWLSVNLGGRMQSYRGADPVEAGGGLWEPFGEAQLAALGRLVEDLKEASYSLEMVGHNEIAPSRKRDPGPAFPWARYRETAG